MSGAPLRLQRTALTAMKISTSRYALFPSHHFSYNSKMSGPSEDQYLLSFHVPRTHTSQCTEAIFKTGAGTYPGGLYSECCFVIAGTGHFRPMQGANPNIGSVGEAETTEEDKVEIVAFGKETVLNAVKALKEAHPYEVVSYSVVKAEAI